MQAFHLRNPIGKHLCIVVGHGNNVTRAMWQTDVARRGEVLVDSLDETKRDRRLEIGNEMIGALITAVHNDDLVGFFGGAVYKRI